VGKIPSSWMHIKLCTCCARGVLKLQICNKPIKALRLLYVPHGFTLHKFILPQRAFECLLRGTSCF